MKRTALTLAALDRTIHTLRGQRVMTDEDLARLYGVPTKRLNEAVKRNRARFPDDFAFRLKPDEVVFVAQSSASNLKSQIATSKTHGGRRRSTPLVFTEQGVAMLSSVLHSPRAIAVNIEIMRAFVRMRAALTANTEVQRRLSLVEAETKRAAAELGHHKAETDRALKIVFAALQRLAAQETLPEPPRERIGFKTS